MPASGKYIKEHLHPHHLFPVEEIVVAAAVDHMASGCEFRAGWKDRVMAKILAAIPDIAGWALEEEESRCPPRGIGVKEAA